MIALTRILNTHRQQKPSVQGLPILVIVLSQLLGRVAFCAPFVSTPPFAQTLSDNTKMWMAMLPTGELGWHIQKANEFDAVIYHTDDSDEGDVCFHINSISEGIYNIYFVKGRPDRIVFEDGATISALWAGNTFVEWFALSGTETQQEILDAQSMLHSQDGLVDLKDGEHTPLAASRDLSNNRNTTRSNANDSTSGTDVPNKKSVAADSTGSRSFKIYVDVHTCDEFVSAGPESVDRVMVDIYNPLTGESYSTMAQWDPDIKLWYVAANIVGDPIERIRKKCRETSKRQLKAALSLIKFNKKYNKFKMGPTKRPPARSGSMADWLSYNTSRILDKAINTIATPIVLKGFCDDFARNQARKVFQKLPLQITAHAIIPVYVETKLEHHRYTSPTITFNGEAVGDDVRHAPHLDIIALPQKSPVVSLGDVSMQFKYSTNPDHTPLMKSVTNAGISESYDEIQTWTRDEGYPHSPKIIEHSGEWRGSVSGGKHDSQSGIGDASLVNIDWQQSHTVRTVGQAESGQGFLSEPVRTKPSNIEQPSTHPIPRITSIYDAQYLIALSPGDSLEITLQSSVPNVTLDLQTGLGFRLGPTREDHISAVVSPVVDYPDLQEDVDSFNYSIDGSEDIEGVYHHVTNTNTPLLQQAIANAFRRSSPMTPLELIQKDALFHRNYTGNRRMETFTISYEELRKGFGSAETEKLLREEITDLTRTNPILAEMSNNKRYAVHKSAISYGIKQNAERLANLRGLLRSIRCLRLKVVVSGSFVINEYDRLPTPDKENDNAVRRIEGAAGGSWSISILKK